HPVARQRLDLARHGAPPDAEDRPTARQVVQRRKVFGEPQRMPLGDDVEHRADADAARALGEEGPEQDAVRDDLVALVLEVVLGQPVAVVAELLGPDTHVEQPLLRVPEVLLLVAAGHRSRRSCPGIVDLDATEEEDPYTHVSIMTHVTSRRATPR